MNTNRVQLNQKVKAFTIIEMTVVMLLSTVVISMAYFAFELLSKRYLKYKAQTEVYYKLTLLDQLLSKDFFLADSIKTDGEMLHTFQGNTICKYEFSQKYVVRQAASQTDTFYCKIQKHELLYNQQPILPGDIVDQLNLSLLFEEKKLDYIYSKHYDAAGQINKALKQIK